MFVLVCAAATIIACRGAFALSNEDKTQVEVHNDSRRLLFSNQTFYLLYRNVKSDSDFGGEAPCAQIRHIEGLEKRRNVSVLGMEFYIHERRGHINQHYVVLTPNKSRAISPHDDAMALLTLASPFRPETHYHLLFTDYMSCFTVRRPLDDVYQVWAIGRPSLTNKYENCHSAYKQHSDIPGCSVERPRYDVFNDTLCCRQRRIE
uniref:Putative secreted histamine binding protein of 20.0 kDa n=1 Tax=Ixodes ricinus TaxID=34613 RepID=V5HEC8_IXORI